MTWLHPQPWLRTTSTRSAGRRSWPWDFKRGRGVAPARQPPILRTPRRSERRRCVARNDGSQRSTFALTVTGPLDGQRQPRRGSRALHFPGPAQERPWTWVASTCSPSATARSSRCTCSPGTPQPGTPSGDVTDLRPTSTHAGNSACTGRPRGVRQCQRRAHSSAVRDGRCSCPCRRTRAGWCSPTWLPGAFGRSFVGRRCVRCTILRVQSASDGTAHRAAASPAGEVDPGPRGTMEGKACSYRRCARSSTGSVLSAERNSCPRLGGRVRLLVDRAPRLSGGGRCSSE